MLSLVAALVLAITMTGCSQGTQADSTGPAESAVSSETTSPTDSESQDIKGLEAVPSGYALIVEADSVPAGSASRHVGSLIIPELGVFEMALLGPTDPAEMRLTVRTPEKQLGYRLQVVLQGAPHPMDMAYLESPLTYPVDGWSIAEISRDGTHLLATLNRGSEEMTVEADLDPDTGIIIREERTSQHLTATITRRLVPIDDVEVPKIEDVLSLATSDWTDTFAQAGSLGYPVFGLDLPALQPHMLQFGGGNVWLNYSTKAEPGRLAVEIWQVPKTEADSLPGRFPTSWSSIEAENGDSAQVRSFPMDGRGVQMLVHDWVTSQGVASLEEIEAALVPLADTEGVHVIEPAVLVFGDAMPLPSGANFGGLLPDAYRSNSR